MSYHVVVYPKERDSSEVLYATVWESDEEEKEACEEIRRSILRHVDNVADVWVVREEED